MAFHVEHIERMWVREKRIRHQYEKQINQILHSINSYDQSGKNVDGDQVAADDILAEIIGILTTQEAVDNAKTSYPLQGQVMKQSI